MLAYLLILNEWLAAEKLVRIGCPVLDLDTAGHSLYHIALLRFNGSRVASLTHLIRFAWRKFPEPSRAAIFQADEEGITPLERSSWTTVHQQFQELLGPATLLGTLILTSDAAVRIQVLFREKHRSRPHIDQENHRPPHDKTLAGREHAALTIQCRYRYAKTYKQIYRNRIAEREQAARKIQAVWKKHHQTHT